MTNKAKQQILRQQMHASFPFLIKIDWKNGQTSRYVNADTDFEFEENGVLQTYTACTFSLQLPESSAKGLGNGTLKISRLGDNTELIGIIRELDMGKRPTIEITGVIVYSDGLITDEVETVYDAEFFLTAPSWGDDTDISFTIKADEGLDLQMPCDILNEITCAGVL